MIPEIRATVTFIAINILCYEMKAFDQATKCLKALMKLTLLPFPSQIILADQLHQVTTENKAVLMIK